ncbi:hypothetical protein [Mycobacterium sp. Aquia_213]|uniref:hypothetical protein n=1 Tax=Mycobacterium sp. Aquia_213 TaxID=2991728 RepID=UPI00226E1418|nr:hypothetical protein [Mycobacterium sp. Aquia_213]WAC94603.1 hypothetical protein LMQ14_04365 [Mycobacterium sp. Aquia_213]
MSAQVTLSEVAHTSGSGVSRRLLDGRQSGVGREMGVAGLEEFLGRKTFAVPVMGGNK